MSSASRPFGRRTASAGGGAGPRCPNCGEALQGPFCHGCGQSADQDDDLRDHAREWAQRWLRSDGVLWSTLALLVQDPARLTRDWWERRRAGRMSPVRTLSLMVVGATLLGGLSAGLGRDAVLDLPAAMQRSAWALALTAVPCAVLLLPRLLPAGRDRSRYDHAAAALYETAFQTLLLLGLMAAAMVVDLLGAWAVYMWMFLSGPVTIGLAIWAVRHAVRHLREAYDLERPQARRIAFALGMGLFIAQLIVGNLLMIAFGAGLMGPGVGERLNSHYEGVSSTMD